MAPNGDNFLTLLFSQHKHTEKALTDQPQTPPLPLPLAGVTSSPVGRLASWLLLLARRLELVICGARRGFPEVEASG